ncbi:SacI homology domain-containing protein [Globomyces pollinis-pini]|nr:SacI homology domain-containing protein [Globomyces pollinis-pini]
MNNHGILNLFISDDLLTFEPTLTDPSYQRESLVLDRKTFNLHLNAPPTATLGQEHHIVVFGIIGLLSIHSGAVLIVISKKSKVGNLLGHEVFKIDSFKIIKVNEKRVSEQQKLDDLKYIEMINHLLSMDYYFSYTRDLTSSCQRLSQTNQNLPLWKRANDEFFWNKNLVEKLIQSTQSNPENDLSRFILPIICGFVHLQPKSLTTPFSYALLARRSPYRAGTRYHTRGIDENGKVANFVETEQIIQGHDDFVRSYVQIRGSIPIFWKQQVGVKYKPLLVIEKRQDTSELFQYHFRQLFATYGPQIAINLINKSGYEGPLGDEFAKQAIQMNDPQLRYIHFDFHHECRKMQWHRISILIDEIKDDLVNQGYCIIKGNVMFKPQTSTVRTNCIDCLDRTNVLQSILAQKALETQLIDLNLLTHGQSLTKYTEFYSIFKNVWADHADAISTQYSGTGALKTDYTRTGKRTNIGVLTDAKNSIVRYIKNHYLDGTRQDAFDFVLGRYTIDSSIESPFINLISFNFQKVCRIFKKKN